VSSPDVLRQQAEVVHAQELQKLAALDTHPRPPNWRLSPWSVRTFILGGELSDGTLIKAKYIGDRRRVEVAIATLATDRALLLQGLPGTGKSWLSEHLAAAISGDSTLLVQGTAGTDDKDLRYGWNYARLLAEGPTRGALVPSPVMRAMTSGCIVRIEELTRMSSEVQDALITILSEKSLPLPELATLLQARPGFNLIATGNERDKGIHDLSSALTRRFNTVILPPPASLDEELSIVLQRVAELGQNFTLPHIDAPEAEIRRVITVFRELREGRTLDGRIRLKSPSGSLSTAEAISVIQQGIALAGFYGDGKLQAADVAAGLMGSVLKDPVQDRVVWTEYLNTVVRERDGWRDLYRACRDLG
jgi:MoxR-like ATPase